MEVCRLLLSCCFKSFFSCCDWKHFCIQNLEVNQPFPDSTSCVSATIAICCEAVNFPSFLSTSVFVTEGIVTIGSLLATKEVAGDDMLAETDTVLVTDRLVVLGEENGRRFSLFTVPF